MCEVIGRAKASQGIQYSRKPTISLIDVAYPGALDAGGNLP
jgi:hypothetical protein